MIAFWLSAVAMLLLGFAFFLPALLGRSRNRRPSRARLNVLLHEQRREELAREAADSEDLKRLTAESERNLLGDLETTAEPAAQADTTGRTALVATLALVPFLGLSAYLMLGRPDLLNQPVPQAAAPEMAQVEESIQKLAERLKEKPEDLEGWVLLGRSLLATGQPQRALQAFEIAQKLAPDNIDLKGMVAEALAEANNGRMEGRPAELVAAILKADPNHKQGLWLAGIAAAERRDMAAAVAHWERLKAQFPAGSEEAGQIARYIAEARGEAPTPEAPPAADAPNKRIRVKVTLAEVLKTQAAADDALFIFARAAEGPPMPLAVVRKQVRDLPAEVELDDSMSMMKGMNLSSFERIVIGARVSKTGKPTPSPGDLQGLSAPVAPKGGEAYEVQVDSVVGAN
jgi:cytochrome c-type biogenesis protein CcmH